MFADYQAVAPVTAQKPKRPPSAYNIYIRDKIAELKAAGHTGNLMKMATEAWNTEKENPVPTLAPPPQDLPPLPAVFGGGRGGIRPPSGRGRGRR
jgi:hypothetical protein